MAHKHAKEMMQYAEDAAECDEPWLLWQFNVGQGWIDCTRMSEFHKDHEYRRKPRTININGFEVPEPLKEMPSSGVVWAVDLDEDYNVFDWEVCGNIIDRMIAKRIAHSTREAAQLHARALLSFTNGDKP